MSRFFRSNEHGMTFYKATGKPFYSEGWEQERVPKAEITVINNRYTPNFHGNQISSEYRYNIMKTHPEVHDVFSYAEDNPPTTLFSHEPAIINDAFADPSMRHTVPTLLAMAHKEHRTLQPASSLSVHSSRLAKKALAMGLITPNPSNSEAEVNNGLDFQEITEPSDNNEYYEEVPQHEVSGANAYLRGLLRTNKGRRKKSMGPQFHQEALPGVDW